MFYLENIYAARSVDIKLEIIFRNQIKIAWDGISETINLLENIYLI